MLHALFGFYVSCCCSVSQCAPRAAVVAAVATSCSTYFSRLNEHIACTTEGNTLSTAGARAAPPVSGQLQSCWFPVDCSHQTAPTAKGYYIPWCIYSPLHHQCPTQQGSGFGLSSQCTRCVCPALVKCNLSNMCSCSGLLTIFLMTQHSFSGEMYWTRAQ